MVASLLLTTSLLVSAAAITTPQAPQIEVLVEVGRRLEGGGVVRRVRGVDMDRSGNWGAVVDVERHGGQVESVVLENGNVLFSQGDVLPNGDRVAAIDSIRMGLDTGPLVKYLVPAPATAFAGRLVDGNGVLLSDGQVLDLANHGPGTRLVRLLSFDGAADRLLVTAQIEVPGETPMEAALRFRIEDGHLRDGEVVANQGSNVSALQHLIDEFLPPLAIAANGSHAVSFRLANGSEESVAGLFDQAPAFEAGTMAPQNVGSWECITPRVACSGAGHFVVGGTVRSGTARGIVANSNEVLALDGAPLPAAPSERVGHFLETEVAITDTGEALFGVPLEAGGEVLVLGERLLLRTGVSSVDGRVVRSLRSSEHGALAMSPTGDRVIVKVELEAGIEALLSLQPSVGHEEPCGATANSVGLVGSLVALGSDVVSVNALRLRAAHLPPSTFGLVLTSRTPGSITNPGGSAGTLCLGGAIGRVLPGVQASPVGDLEVPMDLSSIALPGGPVAAGPGETWRFQLWYRDVDPSGIVTSNFTGSVRVELR